MSHLHRWPGFLGCTSLARSPCLTALPPLVTKRSAAAWPWRWSTPPGCSVGGRAFEDAAGGYVIGREPRRPRTLRCCNRAAAVATTSPTAAAVATTLAAAACPPPPTLA